jgi:hypothetical protein
MAILFLKMFFSNIRMAKVMKQPIKTKGKMTVAAMVGYCEILTLK